MTELEEAFFLLVVYGQLKILAFSFVQLLQ